MVFVLIFGKEGLLASPEISIETLDCHDDFTYEPGQRFYYCRVQVENVGVVESSFRLEWKLHWVQGGRVWTVRETPPIGPGESVLVEMYFGPMGQPPFEGDVDEVNVRWVGMFG